MHELGVVKHVMKTLTDVAAENHVTKIWAVTLQIGGVSGVVTEQLTDCWYYFREKQNLFKDAELRVETIPAVTFCGNCERTYDTIKYGKICPYCKSRETWLLRGNEFEIKEIDAETEESDSDVTEEND